MRLEWYVPAERWAAAPAELIAMLARRCPEALPTRYGDIEPLQQRYDPEQPDAFATFIETNRDVWTFWLASRPSFGGHAHDPEERAPGHLGLDFDWRVLEADPRWREAVAGLFARDVERPRRALRRVLGGAGLARVAQQPPLDHRRPQDPRHPRRPRPLPRAARRSRRGSRGSAASTASRWRRRSTAWDALRKGLARRPVTPAVTPHDGGLCVRLGEQPRAKLPALPLPPELIRPPD